MIASKFSRHFFNQSKVKPKPIVARACTFSRALCGLSVITSSFDWFTGLSPSVLIGQSDYFGFGFTRLDWNSLYQARCKLTITRVISELGVGLEKAAFSRPRSQFFAIRTSRLANNIQLFWETLSGKVHATILKGIVGDFKCTVFQRNLKESYGRPLIYVCQCWRKVTKVGSTVTVVSNSVLIISHITFRDCRVHFILDKLSRNSCIYQRKSTRLYGRNPLAIKVLNAEIGS